MGANSNKKRSVPFKEQLRKIEPITKNQALAFEEFRKGQNLVLHGYAGTGKALENSEPVLTPSGWIPISELSVGDEVIGYDGKIETVTGVYPQGEVDLYKVNLCDGASVITCGEHLWFGNLSRLGNRSKRILTTKQIKHTLETTQHKSFIIPLVEKIDLSCSKDNLPLDPYILGCLLGDGCMRLPHLSLSTTDEYIKNRFIEVGFNIKQHGQSIDYSISGGARTKLRELGLWNKLSYDKFVPEIYKNSSYESRMELIRGLMDTDGTTSNDNQNGVSFCTTSIDLAKDIQYLLRSVGATATITTKRTKSNFGIAYIIWIRHKNPAELFNLPRKKARCNSNSNLGNRIVSVEYYGKGEATCIAITGDSKLFVTKDFIVTHNTLTAMYLALEELFAQRCSNIIIVRSAVASQDIGFLPGSYEEKIAPYEEPYDSLCDFLFKTKNNYDELKDRAYVTFMPISFIRGITFDDAIIILDESQNANFHCIDSVITRLGENSRLIMCGDYTQSDLKKDKEKQDVLKIMSILEKMPQFSRIEFGEQDIVRSKLVREYIIEKHKQGYS